MAILQALLALIGRSAGRILNALFGWAVNALFGFSTGVERTLLTIVVALAALWPLLVIGIPLPHVAAFLVALVPVARDWGDGTLRWIWLALTLAIPAIVGVALAARGKQMRRESLWLRGLRGYPTTLGLALAFWISFVVVPLERIASALRRWTEAYVPLLTSGSSYHQVAECLERELNEHGLSVRREPAGFWTSAPTRVLAAFAAPALRAQMPTQVEYFEGEDLCVALYPAGLRLRGAPGRVTLAHGLAVESLAATDALQTTNPAAQKLERRIRDAWLALEQPLESDPDARFVPLRLSRELARLDVPYDDWLTLYRKMLQLERAARGESQLLELASGEGDGRMETEDKSTLALLREITSKATELVRKEIELARAELRADYQAELAAIKLLAGAAVGAVAVLNLLLVAAALALVPWLEPWGAALVVAGVVAIPTAVLAIVGWRHHVKKPLERTRETVEEGVEWAKEQVKEQVA